MSSSMLSLGKLSHFSVSSCGNHCNPNPTGLQLVRAPATTAASSLMEYEPSHLSAGSPMGYNLSQLSALSHFLMVQASGHVGHFSQVSP